jgi:hypothetical protein
MIISVDSAVSHQMLSASSFICDLRRDDSDAIAASIMASNIAEALWEHFLFIIARADPRSSIAWMLQVIEPSGKLHQLLPDGEFAFNSTKAALASLAALQFPPPLQIGPQDPLIAAINQSSFGADQKVEIFLSAHFCWDPAIEKCVNRAILAESGSVDFRFVVLADDQNPSELAARIAANEKLYVVQLVNSEESFFQFFRSTAETPVPEILQINEISIACEKSRLILDEIEIQSTTVCRCHRLPIVTKSSINCSVSARHISQTHEEYSLGHFLVPFHEESIGCHGLVAQGRIQCARVSESITFGVTWLLKSGNPQFHRLLNELRCHKEAVIAKRRPTRVIGGEFWLLAADAIAPLLHCKRLATRAQLLKLDAAFDAPPVTEICTTPVLCELPLLDHINPFLLGHDDMLVHFE